MERRCGNGRGVRNLNLGSAEGGVLVGGLGNGRLGSRGGVDLAVEIEFVKEPEASELFFFFRVGVWPH